MTTGDEKATTMGAGTPLLSGDSAPPPPSVGSTPPMVLSRPSRNRSLAALRSRQGFLFTIPALILLVASVVYPILWALNLSVHTFDIINPEKSGRFVGLGNYAEILSSTDFQSALFNTH